MPQLTQAQYKGTTKYEFPDNKIRSKEMVELDKTELLARVIDDLKSLKHPENGYFFAGGKDFHWLFGRDSIWTALMLLGVTLNGPQIAKDTLQVLARLQGKRHNWQSEEQPGKILHENRVTEVLKSELPFWRFPYYGSLDATPLFIILAHAYARHTNDWDFIKEIWPSLEAAAWWMRYYGDRDGDYFIECEALNPRGITNQTWKDHTPFCSVPLYPVCFVEVQGYAYRAYVCMGQMSARVELGNWQAYLASAEALRYNFNAQFWDEEQGGFALALDGNKERIMSATSSQGHLLFTGIIQNEERYKKVVTRLMQPDLWTPYGIRTLSSKAPCYNPYRYHLGSIWFFDNWVIWHGLRGAPRKRLKKIMIKTARMLEGAPELHACECRQLKTTDHVTGWGTKPANHVQAWSAAAILHLLCENLSEDSRRGIEI